MPRGPAAPRNDRYLLESERLVAEVQWHPVWLLRPALTFAGVLLVIGWVGSGIPAGNVLLDALGLGVVAALLWFGWTYAQWRTERLLITDRRLLLVTGLLARRVDVMPLRKVTDMTFVQPPFGRLLDAWGWGTFVFESAGQDQALHRVPYLPRPAELYRKLTDEIFGEHGIYGRKPAPSRDTVALRRDEED